MASAATTSNIGLPQWVETEKPERTDFNAAFDAIDDALSGINVNTAGSHNGLFRGSALGASVTIDQYAAIAAGTFENLYIGDYWTISGVDYVIAGFDYYLGAGSPIVSDHHAVIVTRACLYDNYMKSSNTTSGGYAGSDMVSTGLNSATSAINSAFSGHLLTIGKYLSTGTSSGNWYSRTVDLLSETMIFGFTIAGLSGSRFYNIGVESFRLPLFALDPTSVSISDDYWLRDISSASGYSHVYASSFVTDRAASGVYGVRPMFCIK